ncbi:pheromone receptor [Colletotrichum scovillei]|uniref:Pheromone receptor n=1 Tax=Colletotrichum scovillei TaxID=1209932 RepID=A0A9P7RDU6_9PEZI|nr:pheromone receptor [Colletotrichum scovillei]KAG7074995.1 pheromone receptor [Colletotrichum scovillei]KAG7082188.1 pheromone receptor [Colletotrichum scovillei]
MEKNESANAHGWRAFAQPGQVHGRMTLPGDQILSLQHSLSSRPDSYTNTQLVGPCTARLSPPKDFVRGDMKPAPLRLSPKSKETDEASGVSPQQPGASFIENATPTDESTTTEQANDKLPRHPIQLKAPPLAAIVSKFEILDIMTDLETQAAASRGASSVEVPGSSAKNRAVSKEIGFSVKSGLAEGPPPGPGYEEVVELQSTSNPNQISPRRSLSCEPQNSPQTGMRPAVEQTTYIFDPFTGERRPNKAERSANGRQRSLVAERRQLFEDPMGGVRTSLPPPTFSNYGITPQTQTPCYTIPRTKTWNLRPNDTEAPQDTPRGRAEPPLDPRLVKAGDQTKTAVEGSWTRSISKSLGYSVGQRTRPTREKTQTEQITVSREHRRRGKLFGLWPRAMDALHSREASTSNPEQGIAKAPDPPTDQVALEISQSVSRDSTRSSVPQSQYYESQEKLHPEHATSMTGLLESSGNAAIVTAQSKVASLRTLFDETANDTGPESGSRLRHSHTRPANRWSANGNSQTAFQPGHAPHLQSEVSTNGAIRRSFQSSAGARIYKGSTSSSSSLKDRINTLEAICRMDAETRPSTNKTILAPRSKIAGPERETDGLETHSENRFESLGFKRGREVWRKISASWEKGRLEEGKRDENDRTQRDVTKSPEPPTWQGSYLTIARLDDKQLANCSPEKPETRHPAASASASSKDRPSRKSTSAIPRECLSTGRSLDGCSAEQKGALPLSTTGPVVTSTWWQLGSSSSYAPWRTRWDALSGDAHGISWGRWRAPRDRGIVAASKMRKAANRQSETSISNGN